MQAKTLSAGSSGPYVKGMLTGLQRLKFRIPGVGSTFTSSVKDSVMAFQKAYRLSRTYVFNTACWRKLDGAKLIKPQVLEPLDAHRGRQDPADPHGRQGRQADRHHLRLHRRDRQHAGGHASTSSRSTRTPTSGYGGILVRTMGFVGNFAIHGYAPVPPYPASHGCIREPIWACYWVYDHSSWARRCTSTTDAPASRRPGGARPRASAAARRAGAPVAPRAPRLTTGGPAPS